MKVEVACRIRPRVAREQKEVSCVSRCDDASVHVSGNIEEEEKRKDDRKRAYTFTYVFDEDDNQSDIYDTAVVGLIDSILDGHCATLLAYGQTGSGKTWTVLGEVGAAPNMLTPKSGIFLRAIGHLLGFREANKNVHVVIGLSILEIYNEEIFDLLNQRKFCRVTGEDVTGVHRLPVESMGDVLKYYTKANSLRVTAYTDMNDLSSRSHAVFILDVLLQERTAANPKPPSLDVDDAAMASKGIPIKRSRISIVDLAGSERLKRSNAEGKALDEARAINKSLSALGNVVNALYEASVAGPKAKQIHIPYRDSVLTKLLRPSFSSPASRVLLVATVSPTQDSATETLQTMRFADRIMGLDTPGDFVPNPGAEREFLALRRAADELCADLRIAQAADDYTVQIRRSNKRRKKAELDKIIERGKKRMISEEQKLCTQFRERILSRRRIVEPMQMREMQVHGLALQLLGASQQEMELLFDVGGRENDKAMEEKQCKAIRSFRKKAKIEVLQAAVDAIREESERLADQIYQEAIAMMATMSEVERFDKEGEEEPIKVKVTAPQPAAHPAAHPLESLMQATVPAVAPERNQEATVPSRGMIMLDEPSSSGEYNSNELISPVNPFSPPSNRKLPPRIPRLELDANPDSHNGSFSRESSTSFAREDSIMVPIDESMYPTITKADGRLDYRSLIKEVEIESSRGGGAVMSFMQSARGVCDPALERALVRTNNKGRENYREIMHYRGHVGGVYCCGFANDGRMLASGGKDGVIRIWDPKTTDIIQMMTHKDDTYVMAVNWSPKVNHHVASAGTDKTARVWDICNGKQLSLLKHDQAVYACEYNPAGTKLLTGSKDRNARIFDAATGKKVTTLKGHMASVMDVAWSPDGKLCATSSGDRTARVWDVASGKLARKFEPNDKVWSCCFDPNDSNNLLCSLNDGTMRLFDLALKTEIMKFAGHAKIVYHGIYAQEGKRIISSSFDGSLRVWHPDQPEALAALLGHTNIVYRACAYDDYIVSASDGVMYGWKLQY